MKAFFCLAMILFFWIHPVSPAHAEKIRVVSSEEPPTNFTIKGEFSGIVTDIVKRMISFQKLDVDIEVYPWARSIKYARTEPNVIVFTCAQTKQRVDHGFHFIGPVVSRKHILWKKRDSRVNITSIDELNKKGYHVGSVRDDWRAKYLKDLGVFVEIVADHETNARKILAGRFPLWVSSDLEAPHVFQKAGLDVKGIERAFVFAEKSSFIMISKGSSLRVIKAWNMAFKEVVRSGFLKKTAEKWSLILGWELVTTPGLGIHIMAGPGVSFR